MIGIGSFATVYLAHRNSNNELVAIKTIDRARLNKKLAENLIGEIAVLREFRHPNIVLFHELQVLPGICVNDLAKRGSNFHHNGVL